jgi:hypothetical protein
MTDPAPVSQRPAAFAPLPVACAMGILVAIFLPLKILGNQYDPQILNFWVAYGIPVFIASLFAGVVKWPFLQELPARCARLAMRPPPMAFAIGIGLFTTLLTLFLQGYSFDRQSSTADEIAQLWHARVLLGGALSLPVDPNPEFFAIDNIVDVGRWYSQYPIGGPAVLVPGVLIGAPWLIHPVLAGLSAAGVYHFTRIAYGELQGRAVGLVVAQSQNFLFMSATYLNHVPTLFLAVCVMVALAEWERATAARRRMMCVALAGLALGLMATIRPLDAIAVAAAAGAFQLYVIRTEIRRFGELVLQAIAGVIGALPVLLANWQTSGSPLRFGYDVAWGQGHRIGFHMDPRGEMHDFARGVGYASRYVSELNFATLGWPVPLMLIVIVGLLVMRKTSRWDALLLSLVAMQLAAYSLYWGLGEFLGPRFLYTALPAIVIIATRMPFLLQQRFGNELGRAGLVLFLLCAVISWSSPHPAAIRGFATRMQGLRRAFRVDIAGAVRAAEVPKHSVVFVREPTSVRLLHRMWGIGMPREEGTRLLARSDACSLLQGIKQAEADPGGTPERRAALVRQLAVKLPDGPQQLGTRDRFIHFASVANVTDECKEELDADTYVPAVYGTGLLLNRYDAEGRVAGDVIYVADLTDHNEVLRKRFADRKWYRLVMSESKDLVLSAKVVPY